MLTWPYAGGAWHPDQHGLLETCFLRIASEVAQRERVLIACQDDAHLAYVRTRLRAAPISTDRIRLARAASDDVWTRDHGPVAVLEPDGNARLQDFRFNGWGRKYPANLSNAFNRRLTATGAFGGTPVAPRELVLEGGSIESDGAGTLLTTERCLLHPARNPELDRAALERRLRKALGVERILWLAHGGLAGDDTDGHVDTLARFADTRTIVYQACHDTDDEQFQPLRAMAEELGHLRTASGEPYRLCPLPLPRPLYNTARQRLPAGYANFALINDAVLMPSYEDAADEQAAAVLAACFPQRDIVPVDCRVLVEQYGSLHCVTMHVPTAIPLHGEQV